MRTQIITTGTRSRLVRRLLSVCVAVAAISISTFAPVTRAEDPETSLPISISLFDVTYAGNNNWVIQGIVAAQDNSAVSIQFSGASTNSTTVSSSGFFSTEFAASPNQNIHVDATDATGTAHAAAPLLEY